FFSSRRRHTRFSRDWSSDVCSSDLGLESVEFLVTTNPGQAPRPLIRIASGGELSRISLAIQVITASTSATPTLVFDEVDVGIGEIGRASCRERVDRREGARTVTRRA